MASCRLIATSLCAAILITSGMALFAFIMIDFNTFYELEEYQEFIKTIFTCFLFLNLIIGIAINIGKFRNIFSENAHNKVYRFNKIGDNFEREMDNIDSALLTYGLITEGDVKARKEKKEQKNN